MIKIVFLVISVFIIGTSAQSPELRIARLKYTGGGDWYNDPSAEVNLLKFIQKNTTIKTKPEYVFVDAATEAIFLYPVLFLTGHGNIAFNARETANLKKYLENGGFLYVDDDYGLDASFRREMKKVFPEKKLVELPFDYGLYHCFYKFPQGPPKTHQHNDNPPQAFGIFVDKRLAVYYTFEANPSDGWADPNVHNDPENKREEALKFGTNIIIWALSN